MTNDNCPACTAHRPHGPKDNGVSPAGGDRLPCLYEPHQAQPSRLAESPVAEPWENEGAGRELRGIGAIVMSDEFPPEPTSDQIKKRARLTWGPNGERFGFACWYPQMGGYVGKCVIAPSGSCFDVYVWHDGEFPFDEGEGDPAQLHHCDPDQFIRFGETARAILEAEKKKGDQRS